MKKIKVLNGYAGIGGNRKLWPDKEIEVIAVENNPEISRAYKDFFPNDKVIVTDAHKYLLEHYKEFDFIWLSRPCQSHTIMRKNVSVQRGQSKPIYPDMGLYQEIIFLQHYFKGKYAVENVKRMYYNPLIKPQISGNHYFWTNFNITKLKSVIRNVELGNNKVYKKQTGFNLDGYKLGKRKDTVYHNCVDSKLGLHIFNCAFKTKQLTL